MPGGDTQLDASTARPHLAASAPAEASRRFDDRSNRVVTSELLSAKPPVLRRRTVTLITLLGMAAIAYGALAPFHFDVSRPVQWQLPWSAPSPGDSAANVLIYIPIGAFLRLRLRRRGVHWLPEVAMSLLLAGGLSYLSEVVQSLIPARVCTWTDVVLNVIGAGCGVIVAPTAQRWLRGLHAALYAGLRTRPISMAATAIAACIITGALSPPDFYPSPHHVTQAWRHFTTAPLIWTPWPASRGAGNVSVVQSVDKLMTGGAYGLLAIVLFLAARETGRSSAVALWRALSRAFALAAVIELAQLFTISHVAELHDLTCAWMCALAGATLAGLLGAVCPHLHRRPLAVVRGLVLAVAGALLAWGVAALRLATPRPRAVPTVWLPMLHDLHRSWNGLLGDYVTGLLQYALIAALLLLWYRAHRRAPWMPLVLTFTAACALVAGVVGTARNEAFDSVQLLLALAAAITVTRMDRAVFGRTSNTAPVTANPKMSESHPAG